MESQPSEQFLRQLTSPKLKKSLTRQARKWVRQVEPADDLVQETYLKDLLHHRLFDGKNFEAWMYTILKNNFYNTKRTGWYLKQVEVDDFQFCVETRGKSVEPEVWKELKNQEISFMLSRVKPNFSQPVELLLKGFTYQQISTKLNVPLGTIKNRIYSAKEELSGNKTGRKIFI